MTDSIELERLCNECQGDGGEHTESGWETCWICNGAGFVATPMGEKILTLVRHNFRPMLEQAQDGD